MLSPLASEVAFTSAALMTLPPSLCIAVSNDSRVLVLGSKNRLAIILPRHRPNCSFKEPDISSARENSASISPLDKSSAVTRLLFAITISISFYDACHLDHVCDGYFIYTIGFHQSNLYLLMPGAGHILTYIVSPYRHLTMATVNEHSQLN